MPASYRHVAADLGMHPSTVSRTRMTLARQVTRSSLSLREASSIQTWVLRYKPACSDRPNTRAIRVALKDPIVTIRRCSPPNVVERANDGFWMAAAPYLRPGTMYVFGANSSKSTRNSEATECRVRSRETGNPDQTLRREIRTHRSVGRARRLWRSPPCPEQIANRAALSVGPARYRQALPRAVRCSA